VTDWRDPELRREAFQRSYTHSLVYKNFPGMVYSMMPAVADLFDLDEDGRAWLAWLNGNTQNIVTSMMMLEVAPKWTDWRKAVDFLNENFKGLEFDIDRRHQKSKFGVATEQWVERFFDTGVGPADSWREHSGSSKEAWNYAMTHPYMGRISAWSNMEFARILLPFIPDVDEWYLWENSSRSHRNSLCLLSGYDDAWGWDREQAEMPMILGIMDDLSDLADDLLREAHNRNGTEWPAGPDIVWVPHQDVCHLTMESALCTFKSWHKPNRRYPNVYSDMMYQRIQKAEVRMNRSLQVLWDIRKDTLPEKLRLEDNPGDPGLSAIKQNWFRETGEVHYLHMLFPDMEPSTFELKARAGEFGERKDPKW
jgi:hypothetical protein